MITIRLRKNGPYVVEGGEVRVIDWDGREYRPARLPIALCRCGASASKPFCDGSHHRIGFAADGDAAGPSLPADRGGRSGGMERNEERER